MKMANRKPLRGFTLIELLIVVSVIALLISILLPSLKSARSQAKIVVCSSDLANIGKAATGYAMSSDGWLCGSPGTTGSVLYAVADPADQVAEELDTDAVQIWDYAGPLAARYMNMSLPVNRADRLDELRKGVFGCPENKFMAQPFPGPAGPFETAPMVSYNTFRNFLMWPRTMVDRDPSQPWGPLAPVPKASFDHLNGNTLQPKTYLPRLGRVANPSIKAYVADGNRFTNEDNVVSYHYEWDAEDGGMFCNGGPTMPEQDGADFVLSSYHYDEQLGSYGYRHRRGKQRGIAINFFDGHCEFMTEDKTRQPDTWWPKGTIIPFPEFNKQSALLVGQRLNSDFDYVVGR